jgi:tetratricopeptide (TPR) repeat protein
VALVVRLVAHAQMSADPDTFAPIIDSEAYLLQALRVTAGEPMVAGVTFQAPLYPYLLGWTLRSCGVPGVTGVDSAAELPPEILQRSLAIGRALNLALGLLAVLLIWRLALVLFGAGAALWAGLLAATYGPFLFYEGLLLKGALSLLFLPCAVLAAAAALRRDAAPRWSLCGLALGLGGLVRGNMYLLAWGGALALLVWGGRQRRLAHGAACAGALLLGALLAVAPLIVRNSLAAGRLVLTTAAGGTAFYLCNHPDNDTGLIQVRSWNRQVPRFEEEDWTAEAEQRSGRALTPGEVNQFWLAAALAGIRERPATWLLAEARKLGLLVSRYEAPDNTMPSFAEDTVPVLRWTPSRYATVLPLACGGLVLAWTRRRRERVPGRGALALALAGYAASLLLFVVTSRFRLPLAPLVLVYAGVLLAGLRELAAATTPARERLVAGAAVAAGLGLSLASEGPLGPLSPQERASHVAVCLKNRADVALERGDAAAARADLDQALAVSAGVGWDSPALHVDAAHLAHLVGDGAAAERHLQRALQLDAGHAAAWREVGLWAYERGDDAAAVEALERSLASQPRDRTALQYLVLALLTLGQPDRAEPHALLLAEQQPEADDGWGLLALVRLRAGRTEPAREALARYDALAAQRRAAGKPPRFPDQPELQTLRTSP